MPETLAAAAALPSPAAALERRYGEILAGPMHDVPMLNRALRVQAVGFRAWGPHWLGVLVTPWFMNLMRLPLGTAEVLAPGQVGPQRLGEHRLRFIGAHEAAFGPYEMCSLASPMFEFADQQAAVATAREVLVRLRASSAQGVPDPHRRGFLLGRGNAQGVSNP